jgi:hypothetical protein
MAKRCISRSDRPADQNFFKARVENHGSGPASLHLAGWHFDAISASLRYLHEIRKKLEFA